MWIFGERRPSTRHSNCRTPSLLGMVMAVLLAPTIISCVHSIGHSTTHEGAVQEGTRSPTDHSTTRKVDIVTKDGKYTQAYQDYLKRHLSKSTIDGGGGGGGGHLSSRSKPISFDKPPSSSVVAAAARSRMTYGLSKGLLDIRKANEHYLKVHTEARCRDPRPRVVRVKEFYPDPSKEYLPSCTVLHHCSDHTGCCDSDTMQCVAKRQDVVELNFYKLHLSNGGGVKITGADTVEKLSFVNDTECECQVIDDRPRFQVRKTMCLQCPSAFTLREQPPGTCYCDCFDRQKSCLKLKRGREMLAEIDRRCVEARRCHQPECEYGVYDGSVGRCPRKSERRSGHHAGHHWWKFDERD